MTHLINDACCNSHGVRPGGFKRRKFLFSSLAGVAVAALPTASIAAAEVDTLLLSCMDYRLIDDIERFMTSKGLRDNYDHIILAGAALGASTSKFPAWGETFWGHVQVAIDLHKIKRVMLLSHRDCGAYKVILGKDFSKEPALETSTHKGVMSELAKAVKTRYPLLKVESALMSLDGKVEVLDAI